MDASSLGRCSWGYRFFWQDLADNCSLSVTQLVFDTFGTHSVDCQPVCPFCHIACRCVNVLVGLQVKLRVVQVAVQPFIAVIADTRF